MTYRLLPPAIADLDSIDVWVSGNFGTDASVEVQRKLFKIFELLAEHSGIGVARPDITTRPVRFFASGPNWIVYQPGSPTLIHRIFPGALDLERLKL